MSVTDLEKSRLSELEVTIERGQKTFIEVGLALAEIRDSRLYREGFPTFEDYCQSKWGWSRVRAHQLIEAANTVEEMCPTGHKTDLLTIVNKPELPQVANEGQARELAKIKDPEVRAEVWAYATESAEKAKVAVTAKIIKSAVETIINEPPQAFIDAVVNPQPDIKPETYIVLDDAPRQAPDDALLLWDRVREFEREGFLSEDINTVVRKMTNAMRPDIYRLVPRIRTWLGGLDK